MKIKNSKGITVVALIVTVIVMLILAGVGLNYGTKAINRAKIEDIEITMIEIQGKVKIRKEKHSFDNNTSLVGIELGAERAQSYSLDINIGEVIENIKTNNAESSFYILNSEALQTLGISEVSTDYTEFYIVDYNTCEIYYSLGCKGTDGLTKYSLTEISQLH